jgi:glycosyltransferase involved in cell wall biosynthesis
MPSKKFSIVTPSLNQGEYIEQTILSVIGQEGDFEVEYLIMDGGSRDQSVNIIRRYAELVNGGAYPVKCNKVELIWKSEKDAGQSDAINQGLQRASGDYCAYLNSDDLYMPGAFAAVAKAFLQYRDADFIYGDGDVIDQSGNLQWEWLSRPFDQKLLTSYHFLWNDFTNYILQQAVFWRRGVPGKIGLFDPGFHFAMDYEYWVRAGQAGLNLTHVPKKLAAFRMIAGTKSLSSPTVFWSDFLEMVRRYRGPKRMAVFFAYFYMNCAKYNAWNSQAMPQEAGRQLQRWAHLGASERALIARQSAYGEGFACFLIANELQKLGRFEEARALILQGLKQAPRGALRPLGIFPILKAFSGQKVALLLDEVVVKLIKRYRARRIDYRYRREQADRNA